MLLLVPLLDALWKQVTLTSGLELLQLAYSFFAWMCDGLLHGAVVFCSQLKYSLMSTCAGLCTDFPVSAWQQSTICLLLYLADCLLPLYSSMLVQLDGVTSGHNNSMLLTTSFLYSTNPVQS